MFENVDIPTFELKDLVGRALFVKRTVSEEGCEIISAHDLMTKEIFILADNHRHSPDGEKQSG